MSNLLEETLHILKYHDKTPTDVEWVGSAGGGYAMSWDEFAEIANFEYDSGYGGQEIAKDLVVVGSNWWLDRGEYDGSEWWNFNSKPTKRRDAKPFEHVMRSGDSWATLKEVNRPGGKYGGSDDDEEEDDE